MADASSTTALDSTTNGNTGTKKGAGEPVQTPAVAGMGQEYDGNDDFLNVNDSDSLDTGGRYRIDLLMHKERLFEIKSVDAHSEEVVPIDWRYHASRRPFGQRPQFDRRLRT